MKIAILFISSLFVQDGDDVTKSFEKVLRKLRKMVAPSVVAVVVDRSSDPQGKRGSGPVASHKDYYNRPKGPTTGTIINSDGYILTSYFNISGGIRKITIILHDGSKHEAKLLGYDKRRDIALLKIDKKDLPVLPEAKSVRQGDLVGIIGRSPDPEIPTLNHGIISAVNRHRKTAVQTDAELNYGNVGGPLVNLRGELIGVTCHIRPREPWGQSGGVGFATKLSEIKKLLPQLKKGAKIDKPKLPFLGVGPGEGDPDYEGVHIGEVQPKTPAAKAGIKADDIITQIDGVTVKDFEKFREEILKKKIGQEIELVILRRIKADEKERKEIKVKVKLGENPN